MAENAYDLVTGYILERLKAGVYLGATLAHEAPRNLVMSVSMSINTFLLSAAPYAAPTGSPTPSQDLGATSREGRVLYQSCFGPGHSRHG